MITSTSSPAIPQPVSPHSAAARLRRSLRTGLQSMTPWLLPIAILILWQLAADYHWLPEHYLRNMSSPLVVMAAGWHLLVAENLSLHMLTSAQRAGLGLLIGGGLALLLGTLNGLSPFWRTFLDTTLQMLRNIPNLALIPLVILWFGIGETSKVVLVILGTFFPIYLNTYHGIRNVDADLIEMARSYGLRHWALFRHVILPGAMPNILVGLRFSLGIMWLTLIVAETISASSGIGYLAMNAREFLQAEIIIFVILVYALLGFLADWIARRLESHLLRWHPSYRKIKP